METDDAGDTHCIAHGFLTPPAVTHCEKGERGVVLGVQFNAEVPDELGFIENLHDELPNEMDITSATLEILEGDGVQIVKIEDSDQLETLRAQFSDRMIIETLNGRIQYGDDS
jgi:hypothetical protein